MPDALKAISPIDGRYRNKVELLDRYFSEYALIQYRVRIEVEYLIVLAEFIPQLKPFTAQEQHLLRQLYLDFSMQDAEEIKTIEQTTNHDVKAVEYFIKKQIEGKIQPEVLEFVHFGLTSQDINNTATPLMIKEAHIQVWLPEIYNIIQHFKGLENEYKSVTLLARTHGQPASPTILGKEIRVFRERIEMQLQLLQQIPFSAKFGGATGNFNAHLVAYPQHDWLAFGNQFVQDVLGLQRSQTTTQIEHYDNLAALFHNYARINTILIDFCRDIWTYISQDYFKQKLKAGEVGSSAMPHKVNPIDFENAEGNLGLANALFEHLAAKLPVSRLQRDLTDSTVLRNVGVPVAHTLIALQSISKGIGKLIINQAAIDRDLNQNWAVVAEAIQTVLRREGYHQPYEALKALTRTNDEINEQSIHQFVDGLNVSAAIKAELKKISPFNYTGYA
jgi:adenylosuccinate lyase